MKYIREGFEKRLYVEEASGNLAAGSEICACKQGGELVCAYLEEVQSKPCNTDNIYYSHAAPFYRPHRGGCICYSGDFICAKEDYTKAFKRDEVPVAPTPLPGVHLFLGYSRKDFKILMEGRQEVSDRIPNTDQEEEMEVTSTVQQAVSHFTSNNNKTECTISLSEKVGENFVLAATLDVWNEFRMKKNMSDAMKYSEKEECYEAVANIADKINSRDVDMRSHVIMSMFKVAIAEANVPAPPPTLPPDISASTTFPSRFMALLVTSLVMTSNR